MIIDPRPRSLARWRQLVFTTDTLLRALENERLRGTPVAGRTLDVGGGSQFAYLGLLRVEGTVEAININDNVGATWLADLNEPLRFGDAAFDNVISMNTLEHIREDAQLLSEMTRVLKPGGTMIITVPYLYRVHGSPHDYHRHTAQWWQAALRARGFADDRVRIEPLIWGPLSSGLAQFPWFRAGLFGGTLKKIVTLLELLVRGSSLRRGDPDYALGYFVTARKS